MLSEFNDLKDAVLNSVETDIPEVKNAQYWYSTSVIRDLGRIRHVLNTKTIKIQGFFHDWLRLCLPQPIVHEEWRIQENIE